MRRPSHFVRADDHVRGPKDAKVTIIQYGDYDCPHTRASTAVLHEVQSGLRAPIRFVFRHFPMRGLHPKAQLLAEIAEASGTLGHFWEVHELLMRPEGIDIDEGEAGLARAIDGVPLDVTALGRLVGSAAISQRIERDVIDGRNAGVHSTPSWFFNEMFWDGQYDGDTLLQRIERARTRPELGRAEGPSP